ncbi:Trk system potassium uptake protein TrkH [Candidatus Nitrosocosmicus oleophilus]|uniref:Trk system potassium uptake protein TrkH n=1 Tax=Candidatus Nitrosocosmicus oleophilus TaxID=1353260 RepID=A0A654LXM3_9ARCH|nr:potassium transporter TrkG [Candidatus Nitrosocosmicus oleophilus]ALI36228.1 Trk system potassium uptake protein TrkH [Candidatus Nitrosocosmicus oleophilus]
MVTEPLDRSVISYMHHQLVILDEETDAASAVKLMHDKKAETIIVKNKKDEYVGIITDSDILDKIVMKGEDSDQVSLKSIMSSPIITISARANARQALELMRLNVIKRIPVTDNIHILGIVTQEGLAHAIRTSVLEKTFRPYRVVIREHYKPIWGNLGFILQFAGLLFIGPAMLAIAMGELESAAGIFLCITFMFVTGFVLNAYGEKTPMNLRQASVLMVSSFILLSFFGSIPYMYVNPFYKNLDPFSLVVKSFFESASGFTTTGLSEIMHPEDLPKSFDFYRSFTQWIGGLSFVYLIMAFFYPEKKLAHMKSMIGGVALRLKQLLLTIAVIFTIYTVLLTTLLYLFGYESTIYNLSLIFSAITGGGFVPSSTALNIQDTAQMFILMSAMIISALPFAFHYAIFSKEMHTTKMRPEIYTFLAITAISIVVFYFLIASTDFSSKPMFAMFQVISASTNTGFQFIEMSVLSDEGKILLIIIMLIGGTAFSMAGGIKVGRILQIVQKITKKRFIADDSTKSISGVSSRYNNQAHNKYESKSEKIKEEKTFREALLIIALFIVVSFATAIILWVVEQKGFLNSLFESVSALTTTGITTGITSPTMSNISQISLIFNMIAGRFEIIAIVYFFLEISKRKH